VPHDMRELGVALFISLLAVILSQLTRGVQP